MVLEELIFKEQFWLRHIEILFDDAQGCRVLCIEVDEAGRLDCFRAKEKHDIFELVLSQVGDENFIGQFFHRMLWHVFFLTFPPKQFKYSLDNFLYEEQFSFARE